MIVANALTLGLGTSPAAMAVAGPRLLALDRLVLRFSCAELAEMRGGPPARPRSEALAAPERPG